jgi:hypothetical protein
MILKIILYLSSIVLGFLFGVLAAKRYNQNK